MNYQTWNQALVSYFTCGVAHGTQIYLSVDDDILEQIRQAFPQEYRAPSSVSARDDFLAAVQTDVISDRHLHLKHLQEYDDNGFPNGIAFLGATVLAAYRMADGEEISDENYFRRLREVLELSSLEKGRPLGMKVGSTSEEPLWKNWNYWLMENGFIPSAQPGRGKNKYINYPICQSLLRHTDKDKLRQLFDRKHWKAAWDAPSLFSHVRQEASGLAKHLQDLLKDRQRYEAISAAIHEVYEQWIEEEDRASSISSLGLRTRSRFLFAGLYRTEDPFLGRVDYYLYPKQQRGRQRQSEQVQLETEIYPLEEERSGWYLPLFDRSLEPEQLENGAKYPVISTDDLEFLILPDRDFWILIPDPENSESGVYASWGQPSLGTQFIILCKTELLEDLNRLKDERLLEWSGEAQSVLSHTNWIELHQCQVISQIWDGVFLKHQDLKEALQPNDRVSISLSGGLRVPQQNAWLEGYPPQVTVFAFYPSTEIQVTRLSNNQRIIEKSCSANISINIVFPEPGDYLIEATCGGETSQKFLRLRSWTQLSIENSSAREYTKVSSEYQISGSELKILKN